MGRALLVLNEPADRLTAVEWVRKAPVGTRVEFKAVKRSLPQNDRMWAMLTDVATQVKHVERRFSPDQWKIIFMHACGREVQFLPSLDGATFIPWGQSSADLSKDEMSELIDFIAAWGAQHGVVFHDPETASYEAEAARARVA